MSIFRKLESFFGVVKSEYHKSVNSDSFREHIDQTKEIFLNTENLIEETGRDILERYSLLLNDLKELAENIGSSILKQRTGNTATSQSHSDEFEEIAQKTKAKVSSLDQKDQQLSGSIEDIDFEELKQTYSDEIISKSNALILHKDQLIADLKRESEEFDKEIAVISQDFEKGGEKDKTVVYEAKIISLKEQARTKADTLLKSFKKEQEIFEASAAGFKDKIITTYSTHIDKLNEVSKSVTTDFDRLINKMKNTFDNDSQR